MTYLTVISAVRADGNNNTIVCVSLPKNESNIVFPNNPGTKKDLVVNDDFVIVAEHISKTGFSLGEGVVKVYQRSSQELLDEFSAVVSPSKLYINDDRILVVTDISSKRIQLYDLSPLLEKE